MNVSVISQFIVRFTGLTDYDCMCHSPENLLNAFAVGLDEIGENSLMDRLGTKFIFHCGHLVLENNFQPITWVNPKAREGIPYDIGLGYSGASNTFGFENLVIAEIKQSRIDWSTGMFGLSRSKNSARYRFSKYCIGMIGLNKELKHNTFKKIRKIDKINTS